MDSIDLSVKVSDHRGFLTKEAIKKLVRRHDPLDDERGLDRPSVKTSG